MEFLGAEQFKVLSNPGVVSTQLLSPHNSLSGRGTLLLADEATHPITAGDVVRFADGDVHGFINDSGADFVYLSVTSPPINFSYAYKQEG